MDWFSLCKLLYLRLSPPLSLPAPIIIVTHNLVLFPLLNLYFKKKKRCLMQPRIAEKCYVAKEDLELLILLSLTPPSAILRFYFNHNL